MVSTSAREVKRIGAGWVSFADDAPAFAAAIESFIADRRRADAMATRDAPWSNALYNWTNLAKQFEEFLARGVVSGSDLAVTQPSMVETLNSGFEATR